MKTTGDQDAIPRDAAPPPPSAKLDAQRVARIRQRILAGAYDSVEMVDKVARRMLESGDLD